MTFDLCCSVMIRGVNNYVFGTISESRANALRLYKHFDPHIDVTNRLSLISGFLLLQCLSVAHAVKSSPTYSTYLYRPFQGGVSVVVNYYGLCSFSVCVFDFLSALFTIDRWSSAGKELSICSLC